MAIIRSSISSFELAVDSNFAARVNLYDASGSALTSTGGALNVNVSGGGIDVGTADKSAFTYGTSTQQPMGGVYQDASPTLSAGQSGAVRVTSFRGIHVNLRDSNGLEKLGASNSALSIPVVIASDQSPVPASQSGTWNINNITGTVSLPTNAATETTLAALSAKFNSLGQKSMSASVPVVISSDQSPIPVSQSGTWNLNNISGVVSLPTGASTEATLAALSAKFSTLGQKASASSAPVVLASDQSPIPVTQSGIWTVELAAESIEIGTVDQGTPNSLANAWPVKPTDGVNRQTYTASGEAKVLVTPLTNSSIVKAQLQDNAGTAVTLGQKSMASSLPVAIASDQSPLPVTQSGTWNINNISGTVSLPTNAAQETGGHLASIDSKLGTGPVAQDSTIANVQGSAVGGTAAGKSSLSGGIFNTAFPLLTNGQQSSLQLDSSGRLIIRPLTSSDVVTANQGGTWNITNITGTVSLPTGAATEATLSALNAKFGSLGQKSMAGSAPVVIASDQSPIPVSQSGTWNITNVTGTISLPTNAAQETGGHLASIDTKMGAGPIAQDATVANVQGSAAGGTAASKSALSGGLFNTALPTLTNGQQAALQLDSSGRLIIRPLTAADVVSAVQSGTWTAGRTWVLSSGTDSVSAVQSGTWTVQQGNTPTSIANAWPVKPTDGTNSQAFTAAGEAKVLVTPLTNSSVVKAQLQDNSGSAITLGQKVSASSLPVVLASDQSSIPVAATQSGTWNINNISGTVSLPTGASTETTLAALSAKFNSLGQKTSAASAPVVLASDQSAIPVSQSGTWTNRIQDSSGNALGSTGGALNVNVSSGAIDVGTADKSAFTYGTSIQQPVGGVFQDTTPSLTAGQSGVVRLTAQRGMHVNLRDSSGNEKLGSALSSASIPVVIASDQGAVPASQSGTWNINNISGTVSLPTGASTEATLAALSAKFNSLGQKTSAASAPVVLASDQSAIPVSQSGIWNVNNISGTVSLPTNAAQETGGHLASIDTKLGTGPIAQDSTIANVQGSAVGGTAATKSSLSGGIFNTALPILTNGQQAALQLDASGRLIIRPLTSADIVSAVQSGTWTAGRTWTLASGTDSVSAVQAGTWTVQQGNTPTAVANAWPIKLTDGTNVAAVKAASTAAVATDPAVVVSFSPNSALPTGSNIFGALVANQSINLNQVAGSAVATAGVSGLLAVGGNAASGATDSGNPVKVGGVFNTTLPTITNGQRGDLQLDSRARPIISPLTNASVVKAQLQDNAGNGITSTATGVTAIQPLDVNPVSTTANKYIVSLNILQSANTASGTIFTMRNGAAATKDVIIDRIFMDLSYNGGGNASTPRYNIVRFSAATPTGGTTITIAKIDNSSPASQVTDVRFLDTGLTTTGVTFETGNITSFSTSAGNNNNDSVDIQLPIRLAAGEGLAIQILAATRTGISINGHILWSER